MKSSTHLVYGVLAGTVHVIYTGANATTLIPSMLLSAIGSVLPDIDHKNSSITNTLIIPKYLPLKHRGFMHSATLAAIVTYVNVPLGIGMFTHIALDLMNYKTIKLFEPFSDKRFSLKICKSGGTFDDCIRIAGVAGIVLLLTL